jgi:hypothetical protein
MAAMAGTSSSAPSAPEATEKEMKQSMMNEAKAMNNMEGKDEKGDVRASTLAAAMEALAAMLPEGALPLKRRSIKSMIAD